MSLSGDAESWLVSRALFPMSNWTFNRQGIAQRYRELMRSERATPAELEALQVRRLREVLAYAGQWVPYYRQLFRRIGFRPQDLARLADFQRVPPLSRQDLVAHRLELVDERWRGAAEAA